MLFDTHAHYDAPEFDQDRDALLARLPEQDVSLVVNPGCDPASSRAATRQSSDVRGAPSISRMAPSTR